MYDWKDKDDKQIATEVIQTQGRLEGIRKPLEPLMDLVLKLFHPRLWDMQHSRREGTEAYGVSIYDHVPNDARRKFSAGFVSQTATKAPASEQSWINFISQKRDLMEVDRVKTYMQEAAEQERSGFDNSTFYRQTAYQDQISDASCLWGVMSIDTDIKRDRLIFRRQDPRNHWFSVDMFGDVNVNHFKHTFTAKNLAEQFETSTLPVEIQEQAKGFNGKDPYTEYKVIQAIYENGSRAPKGKHNLDKKYIQLYVFADGQQAGETQLIEKKGLDWAPSVLRIGERLPSGYPLTMAMDALTAATYANTMAKHGLQGSHAMVSPPVLAHENLRDQIRRHKLQPKSNTYYQSAEEKIEFLNQRIDPRYMEEWLNREDGAVNDRFFVNFFELITQITAAGNAPTATQINRAIGERIGQMTPVIESSEDDSLEPSVDAIWINETRAGRMPDAPQELIDTAQGGTVRVLNQFNGGLAHLKRTIRENQSMVEALAIIKEMKDIFPQSLVIVKGKRLLEKMLTDRVGQSTLHTDFEIAQIEQGLAQLEQEERQMQQAERMAKVIPSVTKDAVDPQSPAALAAAG